MPQTTVVIPAIHCESCSALIKDVSSEFPAVQSVTVDLATKKVSLEHDASFDVSKWTEEIESLNPDYKVQPA